MIKPMKQVLDDISKACASVQECMDESRERSLVLTKLDEARMWAIEYCIESSKEESNNGTI